MNEAEFLKARADVAHRRAQALRDAAAMGVDEAFIARLVPEFYRRIRADAVLGPIFEKTIEDRWPVHLARMVDFWSSVAPGTGRYSGRPVRAHVKIPDLTPAHFDHWLRLFRATLDDIAPTPEAAAFFLERAERIAASLVMAVMSFPQGRGGPPQLRAGSPDDRLT